MKNHKKAQKQGTEWENPKEATTNSNFRGQIPSVANEIKFLTMSSFHPSSTRSDWENINKGTDSLDPGSPISVTDSG